MKLPFILTAWKDDKGSPDSTIGGHNPGECIASIRCGPTEAEGMKGKEQEVTWPADGATFSRWGEALQTVELRA